MMGSQNAIIFLMNNFFPYRLKEGKDLFQIAGGVL